GLIGSDRQNRMGIAPACNVFKSFWAENRCLGGIVRWESPELPLSALMIEICYAGIVRRPDRISNLAAKQFFHAIRIVIKLVDRANCARFAREKQLFAVAGR